MRVTFDLSSLAWTVSFPTHLMPKMAQLEGGKQLAIALQSLFDLIQDHLRQNQLLISVEFEHIISR